MDAFDALRDSAQSVRAALGGVAERILTIDDRQRDLPKFEGKRHRLAVWLREADRFLATRDTKRPAIDIHCAHELSVTASCFQRWSTDPEWPELLKALADATSYPHALHTLLIASSFPRHQVRLNPTRENLRTSDLGVDFGTGGRLSIEVKAPLELQRPEPRLDNNHSNKLINRLMKKADDQLLAESGDGTSGLLAVGGFHLGREALSSLARSFKLYLQRKGARRPHLCGIMISNFGVLFDQAPLRTADGDVRVASATRTRGFNRQAVVENAHYSGAVPLALHFGGPDPDVEGAQELMFRE